MTSPLLSAFPSRLATDVSRIAAILDPPSGLDTSEPFTVTCGGEMLHIPHRIYRPVISESQFASLSSVEQSIAACWFTRHCDGHVRESFLRALPAFDSPWVIAYVVKLCGEYVVEMLDYIWERRSLFDVALLGRWIRENPEFYSRTRRRVVSYWDCYYRTGRFEAYVGSQLFAFFDESMAVQHAETGAASQTEP